MATEWINPEIPPGPVVELESPVDPAQFSRALQPNGWLNCRSKLAEADWRLVDDFLGKHPQACLRSYQALDAEGIDLDFLKLLPSLRDLWLCANAGNLVDLAPLGVLSPDLRALTLDTLERYSDKSRDRAKSNTDVLARFRGLLELCICGHLKDLDFIAALPRLRSLRLWRNKLKRLDGIEAASQLHYLELKSCGARQLGPIARLQELRALEIWDQRKLEQLEALAALPKLRRLWLVSCGHGAALPDFAGFGALRVLVLESMADAHNLEAVANAPALRCLVLGNARGLDSVEAFRPLAGHPALQEVRVESERLRAALTDAYGWKTAYPNFPADEFEK